MCRSTRWGVPLTLAALLAAGAAAAEPCHMGRMAELPVTMEGMRPLVHAAINGRDALFIADSGAFFSMLTPAAAQEFHLALEPTPIGFWVEGVGGSARASLTRVQKFTIFNIDVPRVPFLVAGNDLGQGAVGLLGQNVFRLGDVEYDLANGVINIMRTQGDCRKSSLAYWANAKGAHYSVIDIDSATAEKPHTSAEAYVNGSKIHVMFDTGAGASFLTLKAAKRAGITPDTPGVTPAGFSQGIGRHTVRTWIAPFPSFRIGDEEIRNTHLRIADEELGDNEMVIGPDFFLSHHILVASSQRRLYFTYNGGPVFNLTTAPTPPAAPQTAAGAEPDTASSAQPEAPQEQLDASGYARRGSAFASRHDYERAFADLTRAIELAPTESSYFYARGMAYWAERDADKAVADLDQAIKLKPDYVDALMARARLHAGRGAGPEAISADLDAVDRAAPRESEVRLALGGLYEGLRNYPAAIAQYDRWIDSHRYDIRMPQARNQRCWTRALAGSELDKALDDCNFAVHASPKAAAYLDSRGLVYLRQRKYDRAIADYDAALAIHPKSPWSLYGRGLARQHLGQSAAAEADIAAAKAVSPKIAEEAARDGIGP